MLVVGPCKTLLTRSPWSEGFNLASYGCEFVGAKATRLCGLDSKSQLLVKDVGVNRTCTWNGDKFKSEHSCHPSDLFRPGARGQ